MYSILTYFKDGDFFKTIRCFCSDFGDRDTKLPDVLVVAGSSQLSMGKGCRGTFFRLRQKQITSFYLIIIKLF